MNANSLDYIKKFEKMINDINDVFKKQEAEYFFTEKELHSYFYHLCVGCGFSFDKYNLIHTEYPTPFKCSIDKSTQKIIRTSDVSQNQRAHIDMVLINPNFISFIKGKYPENHRRYINGIGGVSSLFSKYIVEHRDLYREFAVEYGESILLYALEFKFQRHSYAGEKYSKLNIIQDFQKLKLLKDEHIYNEISYCQNAKSLVFVVDIVGKNQVNGLKALGLENSEVCKVIVNEKSPNRRCS